MEWERADWGPAVVKSWCDALDAAAAEQAAHLAKHPKVVGHVALMPDAHVGFGMPIGGVIATADAVIPNAVGVDIGCGMAAVQTNLPADRLENVPWVRMLMREVKQLIPMGEGHAHREPQAWEGLEQIARDAGWCDARAMDLAARNLGTLGGGNHFIEIQAGSDGFVWLMLHSGSRNLGSRIAEFYHRRAQTWLERHPPEGTGVEPDLAWLDTRSEEGRAYVRDMTFALGYARENRRRMMDRFKEAVARAARQVAFPREINIHHNYAAEETHFGRTVWVHRKGATSARDGEWGIIPGSMGTHSFIVQGLGNEDSLLSSSHGAGRSMGRKEACRKLSLNKCNAAMRGVVFDGFAARGRNGGYDLEEAPQAYKDIDRVMESQRDLTRAVIRLDPKGVLKG